ncbi:MAG: response regulator transcription factor [Candidatus Eremiobacteraeota bacterium]|nr:response regulator transcription factor [Candidatus Eremiobacteraeota bacterium]MBV9408424.1 response regulator transcription factor [Candidatus Eremiobacteraeota bacterium]
MIRVAVVDDHPIVTDGVVANLRASGEIEIVATGTSADDAIALAGAQHPDVLILDLELAGKNGIDAIRAVKDASPQTRIVIFSAYAGEERVATAFERGADSYVLKGTSSDELVAVVRAVAAGGTMIPPEIGAQLARAVRQPRRDRLTEREREILALLAEGLSNRAAGERLGITERTVKFHVGEILGRLGAANRAQAVAIAKARGIV